MVSRVFDFNKVKVPYVRVSSQNKDSKTHEVRATVFDIRVFQPNKKYMTAAVAHSMEHLLNAFLRDGNPEVHVRLCAAASRTGFYWMVVGDYSPEWGAVRVMSAMQEITKHPEIKEVSNKVCANYTLHDFSGARKLAKFYIEEYPKTLRKIAVFNSKSKK